MHRQATLLHFPRGSSAIGPADYQLRGTVPGKWAWEDAPQTTLAYEAEAVSVYVPEWRVWMLHFSEEWEG